MSSAVVPFGRSFIYVFHMLALTACLCVNAHAQWDEVEDPVSDARAVESGKRALGSITDAPWYDAPSDDARSVVLRPDKQPAPRSKTTIASTPGSNVGSGDFAIFGWMLLAVLVFVILFLVVKYLSRSEAEFRTPKKLEPGKIVNTVRLEDLPVQLSRTVVDPLSEAKRLAALGRLAEATVYLYSHVLIKLTEAGLIHLAKGKTNRQYLGELRTQPRIEGFFYGAMTMFEDSYFGDHPPTIERFSAVADAWPAIGAEVARAATFTQHGRIA